MKKAVIVIPTYNERENILNLLRALEYVEGQAYQLFYKIHILVVDDNSPDGTGRIVENYQKDKDNVRILYGKKEGLGRAYLRGFKHAKQKMRADVIIQMDADFSHRPEDVLRLLKNISAGADYVIGSRYTAGGTVPADWPLWRRLNSQIANFVARYLAGLHKIKDCTSGFKAINTEILKNIRWDKLKVNGYVFQIRLLHEALRKETRITEIPINFIDRTLGESKLGISDIIEFIFQSLAIRWDKSQRVIKFLVGASLGVYAIIYFNQHPFVWQPNNLLLVIFATFSIVMTVQSLATIFGMLHVWDKPEHLRKSTSPKHFISPRFSFTALIPALHEETVIGETIEAVSKIDYPEELKEVLVICRSDDQATIDAVNTKIREL
ncbi:MAG TPA: glycosyltransferase, partial [Patescibacteria group bacterium]|nr:glycosyltransferase [Patescibacteria group bacterium]